MKIFISTDNIIKDIGARYLIEAQTTDAMPPKGLLIQSLNEARARLIPILGRFYVANMDNFEVNDSLAEAQMIVIELAMSSRRASGKAQAIADAIHSYTVNSVLAKIYSSFNADLASKHDAQAVSDAQVITQLLYSKQAPVR